MKSTLIFIALCAASMPGMCQSDAETRASWLPNVVGVNLASKHSNYDHPYNDSNVGAFVRWADESGQGFGAGVIHNSHRMASPWLAYTFTTPSVTPLKLRGELTLGVITNYPRCTVCPMVQAGGSAELAKGFRAHLGWSPKPRPDAASVVHLFVSKEF